MSFQQDYDFLFKILLIGNSAVGKSSLLLRFSDNVFNESFLPTIGVDFKIRTFELQGKTVKLQIWDTAGQERFKTITSSYYKGAHGIILVYDITDKASFKDLENWLYEVESHADDNVVQLVVGNKKDLENERQVSTQEGQEYADSLGFKFLETSAKESVNVDQAFITMTKEIKKRAKVIDDSDQQPSSQSYNAPQKRTLQTKKISDGTSKKKKGGCC